MKVLSILLTLMSAGSSAIVYIPVDYPALYRDADLIAVAQVTEVKDTGGTKELIRINSEPSQLSFREFKATLKIVSLLKGETKDKAICTLYRYPTLEECLKEYGGEEGRVRLARSVKVGEEVDVFLKPPSESQTYLVYLRRLPDGSFVPVTGDSASNRSIFQLR